MIGRAYNVLNMVGAIGFHRGVLHYLARATKREYECTMPIFHRPFSLRLGGADPYVLVEVLRKRAYAIPFSHPPAVIVDAGAHIGVASVFFLNSYSRARVVALEPNHANYVLAQRNLLWYRDRVGLIEAGLWSTAGRGRLKDRGTGNWGWRVDLDMADCVWPTIKLIRMEEVLQQFALETVDLFKCDIEGSEREVFTHSDGWLHRVSVVAIELHDRFQPGCREAVLSACGDFPERLCLGRTLVLGRKGTLRVTADGC